MHSRFEIDVTTGYTESDNDLVSLEQLKSAIGITVDTEDESLETLITLQSRMIADVCDRPFRLASAVETFSFGRNEVTAPNQALSLRLTPVDEIESVTHGGAEVTDYQIDKEKGHIWLTDGSWSGTVVVTYSGGYELPDAAPAGLAMACIEAVRERRFAVSRGDTAVRDTAHGDTRVSYFSASLAAAAGVLSPTVLDLIKPYKRLSV